MPQTIVTVDAFTSRPFAGNPAAVCVMDAPADEQWMRDVASEMNLSETAFLHPLEDGWSLRWFTPAVEVDLCGHATLASAHVLWEDGRLPRDAQARFHTRSGLLTAARDGDWITLDFPAKPEQPSPAPDGMEQALGARIVYAGRSVFDWLVELESEEAVRALAPDLTPRAAAGSTTLSRASSRRGWACPRTPSRAPRTACWRRSGPRAWGATR